MHQAFIRQLVVWDCRGRLKISWFVEGAGIAILLLAGDLKPQVALHHLAIYHDPLSTSSMIGGLAIDLVAVSILFGIALLLLDRYHPQQSGILWAVFLAFWITMAVNLGMLLWSHYRADRSWAPTTEIDLLCVMLGVALLLWHFFPLVLEKSVRAWRVGR